MLQVHHFSFEFIFQNILKSKLISQRLSQNADGTCHTNLSNTHYSDLIVRDRSLFFLNWRNQSFLKSCPCAQGREVLQTVVRLHEDKVGSTRLARDPRGSV